MSNFGDLVKRLRKEKGLTLEAVAKKIGSHKGYVSGIENDKVNPPSVKIIRKFAKLFSQDEKTLVRIAWADKAPQIIREDAQRVLALTESEGPSSIELARIPLLNTVSSGYSTELAGEGRVKPVVTAMLVLPRTRTSPEAAATVCDASMEQQTGVTFSRGDAVLLVREEKIKNGSIVYIVYSMRQKRQGMIRQVMLEQGDHIVLQPLNKEFPLEFLTHDDVDAVYQVVGKVEMFESAGMDVKV
ncbi:MAG TPA: helix-turn-helix domain-containing protein [Planctomycetota bacterium]|nr:helix-turn-helix domain-containing protein [Planctomycetota bacterium]